MKRTAIAACSLPVVLVVAGLGYALASSIRSKEAHAGAANQVELKAIQEELRRLKAALSERRSQRAHEMMKTAHSAATRVDDPELGEDEADVEAESAEPKANQTPAARQPITYEQATLRVENRFVGEPVDAAWRQEATAAIRQTFTAAAPAGSRVSSIDCKSSLCRVEMFHKSLETFREFAHAAMASPETAWRGGTMMHVVGDAEAGELKAVAYLARPGDDLGLMVTGEP